MPGGIAGIAGWAGWAAAEGADREDDFDFDFDFEEEEEGAEAEGAETDGFEADRDAEGSDAECDAEVCGACTAAIDAARAAYCVGSGANAALGGGAPCAASGDCTGCGAEPRALPVCGIGCGPEPCALLVLGARGAPECDAERGVPECGVLDGVECGVLVYAGASGRCVPGRGIFRGRPGGVTMLPGSVGTRGAASIRLREIDRLLSRRTATRLWGSAGSAKCGGDGSRSGSARRCVFAADEEWMLPARAGRR